MQGTRGAIRSGGDGMGLPADAVPPSQAPLAFYSGIVRVGPDGRAAVTFDLPPFNGTARVMAVAWSKQRIGNAATDVVIRDPVVLAGTLPRFLSVGDQSRLLLQLHNVELPAGEFTVDIDLDGPVLLPAASLQQKLRLPANGRGTVVVPLTAAGAGTAAIDVTVSGAGFEGSQRFALRVQPGSGGLIRRTVRPLEAGRSLTVSQDLLADILPGTGAVSLSVSPLAALDVPGLLQALDRYPYGCSEQIVSRALPLLYVNRLASIERLALDGAADARVREAIERLLARQGSNGSFGLWSVGGEDMWLAAYVTDFLTRARERGFAVPQVAFTLALDRLRNFVANTTELDDNASTLAYAAYVLARNGRPVMGDLRYFADTKMGSSTRRCRAARSPPPWRSSAIAAAPRPRSRRRCRGCGRAATAAPIAATTVRGCATAPVSSPWSPSRAPRRRRLRRSARPSRRSAAPSAPPARRRMPGWCSPPRPWPRMRRRSP
jgi:uncharacterized protein YfaS (alpha-2-macroglobulin family)